MVRSWTVVVVLGLALVLVGCEQLGLGPKKPPQKGTVKVTVPNVVTPKVEPPKVEPPKPKVEPPKVEPPKVEPPKVEPPKVEPPKVEPPKVEPPKVEPPKVEPPKEAKPALKELKPNLIAAEIAALCNSDGLTDEGGRDDSDLDEWKQSFPAEAMPAAGTFEPKDVPTAFLFPDKTAGKKNNIACAGQTIALAGKAKALHLLVTATDGNQQDKITINYDGASVQADLKVTDWCQKPAFGEQVGVAAAQRVKVDDGGQGTRSKVDQACSLWVVSIPLDEKRELKSIKLPYNSLIHIFAVTLAK
jgi:hypothetical protein